MEDNRRPDASLWTRDFTIITVGTVISMFGNAIGGFATSLMVLDISKSTLLYAVYLAMFTIPQIIMPLFSGAGYRTMRVFLPECRPTPEQ